MSLITKIELKYDLLCCWSGIALFTSYYHNGLYVFSEKVLQFVVYTLQIWSFKNSINFNFPNAQKLKKRKKEKKKKIRIKVYIAETLLLTL